MAVISISRQVAALGDEVASEVASRLGYRFINRHQLEDRILDLGFPREKLSRYDEKKVGFFASLAKDRDEYLNYLETSVLELVGEEGNCVVIGRGSFAILEALPSLISLRFVAAKSIRRERLKAEFNWNDTDADARIHESDANRAGFHKGFFNIDIDNPANFQMVLNTGIFDVSSSASIITHLTSEFITTEKEKESKVRIRELLECQSVVNALTFEKRANVEFLRAVLNEKGEMELQGVATNAAIVQQTILAAREHTERKVVSAISVMQDFGRRM